MMMMVMQQQPGRGRLCSIRKRARTGLRRVRPGRPLRPCRQRSRGDRLSELSLDMRHSSSFSSSSSSFFALAPRSSSSGLHHFQGMLVALRRASCSPSVPSAPSRASERGRQRRVLQLRWQDSLSSTGAAAPTSWTSLLSFVRSCRDRSHPGLSYRYQRRRHRRSAPTAGRLPSSSHSGL